MPSATTWRRVTQAVRAAPPAIPMALGWLAVFVYAYPGQMTAESFTYLRQVRTRFVSDEFAPAISVLWHFLELFLAGPACLLILQTTMFVLGARAILQRAMSPRAAGWTTAAIAVFPPVLASLAMISTYTLMASFLVLGAGGLVSDRRRVQLAGLAALFGATLIQPSALVATLPLVLALFVWHEPRRYLHAFAAWLAITAAAFGADALITHQRSHLWNSALASRDIAGTLQDSDERRTRLAQASPIAPASSEAELAGWLTPDDGLDDRQRDALARVARELASAHPGAYVSHRLSMFADVLWLDGRHLELAIPSRELPIAALKVGVPTRASAVQAAATCVLGSLGPLFAPSLYLALALVLAVGFARKQRDVLAILGAGIAFELSLLVTAASADYAQSGWLIATACLAVAMVVARRVRP